MLRSRFVVPLVHAFEAMLGLIRVVHFAGVHIAGADDVTLPNDRALLIVANHVSWWDGFFLRAVQRRVRPAAALLTVMSQRQLERFPFFTWMGAIGVEPRSFGSVRALVATLASTRSESGAATTVAFFPSGRIWPSSKRPLGFRRGVMYAARSLAPATILPVALHIEPLTTMRPHAFILIGEPIAVDDQPVEVHDVEAAVTATMDRLREYIDRAGEDAARDWHTVRTARQSPRQR